jgi:hypothetical protein
MIKQKYTTQLILTLVFGLTNAGLSQTLGTEKIDQPFPNKKGVCLTLRSPGKDKKGEVVKGDYLTNMPKVVKLNAGWNYSWGMELQPKQPEKKTFVPMVFSVYGEPTVKDLASRIEKALAPAKRQRKETILLGFNEPDGKEQGNLSVEKALKYWKSLEAQNLPLCSPSCVHPNKEWMTQFMAGVKRDRLRVDYIGVHNYGGGSVEGFKKLLKKTYLAYDKRPIIVTEFAVADWSASSPEKNKHSPEKVLKFMQEILPWMDKQDWIVGYAWFSFGVDSSAGTSSALFDEKGNLTKLGEFYANHQSNPK